MSVEAINQSKRSTGNMKHGEQQPLNVQLRNKTGQLLRLKPRSYQDELFKKALDENVIIFLGTGLGKTFIIVLYLNSPLVDSKIHQGKKVVFLATTQDLVKQQAEYINKQVPYRVKIFCGRTARCGEHIDHWNESTWKDELKKVDLLFMTPRIFSNAIASNLLDWSDFASVVFDEFHHSCKPKKNSGGSDYYNILQHYNSYYSNKPDNSLYPRPRLIGLTASLINSMPKDRDSISTEVSSLERLINGRCVTNMDALESRPTMIMHSYFAFSYTTENDVLTRVLTDIKKRLDDVLKNKITTRDQAELVKIQTYHIRLQLAARGLSIKPKSFPSVIDGLLMIRQRCGLWALEAVGTRLVQALDKPSAKICMPTDTKAIYSAFTEMMRQLVYSLNQVLRPLHAEQSLISHTCAKPICLLDVLKREFNDFKNNSNGKDSFSCIIFVRSRLEVTALNQWLQHVSCVLPEYSFIKCDYAIGLAATMASKYSCITKRKPSEQYKMLENFRNGSLNVLVTTSVLEEGIDLPVCSTVIRYDLPNNFREYVQSRGRARQKTSSFVFMCLEVKRPDEESKLCKLNDFEITLKKILNNHDVKNDVGHRRDQIAGGYHQTSGDSLNRADFYVSRDNAVRIGPSTAKTIIHMYCQLLSRRTPFSEGVRCDRVSLIDGTFQTTIFLPSGCPLEGAIVGNPKSSQNLADNSAIVAALRALVKVNELNENGTPFRVNEQNLDDILDSHDLKPNYLELSNTDQYGISEKDSLSDREFFLFKPRLRTLDDYISKDYKNKTYRLISIRFAANNHEVRSETKNIMEKPVFGIIFDSAYDTSLIPDLIHTHYGKFEIISEETSGHFSIDNWSTHVAFLNYSYRLLTRCLGIRGLKSEEFRYHCQFYIVPLTVDNKPDSKRLYSSFSQQRHEFVVGDVVKPRRYFTGDSRGNRDLDKLMIVRAIRRDMNARSLRPGRERITFGEDAERRFNLTITRPNQPVIEVMPLSSEYARVSAGKRQRADYRTQSLFYLEQFLQFFDDNAAEVIQSFCLPEILYKLYLQASTTELDRRFVVATQGLRETLVVVHDIHVESEPMTVDIVEPMIESVGEEKNDEDEMITESKEEAARESASSDTSDSSDDELECSDEEMEQRDTDYDSDAELMQSHEKMITAQKLSLNDQDEDDLLDQKWDFSKYQEVNIERIQFERRSAPLIDLDMDLGTRMGWEFGDLEAKLDPFKQELLSRLEEYEIKVLGEAGALEDDLDLCHEQILVDRSITPPLKFNDPGKPFRRIPTRILGLMESLTLKGAQQAVNLEAIENIGDSYLKYLTSVILHQSVEGSEGILTSVRSRLTCNRHFTYLARKMKLGTYAISKPFSRERFAYALGQEIRGPYEETRYMSRLKSKDLADIFESIVGSYLVYQGEYEAILALRWLGFDVAKKEDIFLEFSPNRIIFAPPPSALVDGIDERHYRACKSRMSRVEAILGYEFRDPSYLIQALTHASYLKKCTRSYERLEFLGDAILDFLITMTLHYSGSIKTPGQMTASRSALVNNSAFARLALKYKLDIFLLYFNAEIYDELVRVRLTLDDDPDMACFDLIEFDGVVKLLGDLFESVAGAVYLDSGCSLDAVWSVYYPILKDNIDRELACPSKNLLALLYETFPGTGRITFDSYDVKSDDGDMVGVMCRIRGLGEFEGRGLRRSQAKKRAVQAAMAKPLSAEQIEKLNLEYRASNQAPEQGRGRGRGRSNRGQRYRGRGH